MAHRTGLGAPAERNDPGALRIGAIGGVDVMVRSSWLVVAALIAYVVAPGIEAAAPGLGAWNYVAGVAFAVLLTLSLLLHEISHALMAKRFHIGVRSITLHFIGGVTAMDGEPSTPKQEFAISAVGPATSLGIGGLAFALLQVTPPGLLTFVVGGLAWANLVVGVLNLIPGMPLDGGRVLRAGLWRITGDQHKATSASGWVGRGVAVLVLLAPWVFELAGFRVGVTDYIIAIIFAWFMWSAATSAIMTARVRSRLPALRARTLARRTLAVPEELPLAEAIRQAQGMEAGSIVAHDAEGRPVGLVNEAAVLATPEERRAWMTVRDVTRRIEPGLTLPADIAGEKLLMAMQSSPATEYLLLEPDGGIYGVLVTSDVDAQFGSRG